MLTRIVYDIQSNKVIFYFHSYFEIDAQSKVHQQIRLEILRLYNPFFCIPNIIAR